MYFIVVCTDKPDHEQVRLDNRPEHIEFLKSAGDRIKLGGATTTADGERPTGSFLLVEGESQAEVEAWAAEDPFNKAGLFESVLVRRWNFVLGDGLTK